MEQTNSKNRVVLCQLLQVIKFRDVEAINKLLYNNSNISASEFDNHRVIHWLFHGVNCNLQLQGSIINILKIFLDRGVNVNVQDSVGRTVLHLAIENLMSQVIDFLLSRGANLHVRDCEGDSILHFLIKVFARLEANRFRYDILNQQMLVKEGTDFIRWMILKGLNVDCQNERGCTALHVAASYRKESIARLVLEYSKNVDLPDKNGDTALNIVMDHSDVFFSAKKEKDVVRILLSKGANFHQQNNSGISPLIKAVMKRNTDLLQMFQEQGCDIRHRYAGGNLLHYLFKSVTFSTHDSDELIFNFLIDQGCDVNGKDNEGMTPLHFAARQHDPKLVKRLIEYGAEVNRRDTSRGFSPLHEAAGYNLEKIVTLLLDKGANINAKTNKGQNVLHLISDKIPDAIRHSGFAMGLLTGKKTITQKLVERGAHIDVKDDDDLLPLHTAILRQGVELMQALWRFGADINDNVHVLSDDSYNLVSSTISEHVIKLKAAALHVDKKFDNYLALHYNYAQIQVDCLSEVECLKSYKITNSTSLYNLMHMDRNSVTTFVFANDEHLKEAISSPIFEVQFPMYHVVISGVYYRALNRRKLLEPAKNAWYELTNIRLPDLCIYEIFSYLSNVDLRVLTEEEEIITVI